MRNSDPITHFTPYPNAIPDAVILSQELIRFPSITPHNPKVIEYVAKILQQYGFECYHLVFEEEGTEPVDNLFAIWNQENAHNGHLAFAGHTDVVPVGDESKWQYPPFSAHISDGVLYGRGAEDMKCAIAAFISATAKFITELGKNNEDLKKFGAISLIITNDEEGPAINGTKKLLEWMEQRNYIPTQTIVGEPTNPTEIGQMIKIGRRGSINCKITVTGKQGHIAYPKLACNPIDGLIDIISTIRAMELDNGNEHFDPSNLEFSTIDVGNQTENMIPDKASAKFNIRFNNMHSGAELEGKIKTICSYISKDWPESMSYKTEIRISGEAFLTKDEEFNNNLQSIVKEQTGIEPEFSTSGGTSDARFIANYCPVVEFGTTGKTPHQVNECINISDIYLLSEIYYEILNKGI